jgi:integrase
VRRQHNRLSAITVKNAKRGLHADGGNLYLRVADGGSRSWMFRFGLEGRERWMGLGPAHTVSLQEARERARQCRLTLLDGHDPIEARKAQRAQGELAKHAGTTFRDCAERLIASREIGWSNAVHRSQWRKTLAVYAYPVIGEVAAQAIDTPLVLKVLEPIWQEKPETANRLRARIEAVLDWAKARGIRSGENPARWKAHLDHLLPARAKVARVKHHAALPYTDVGTFLCQLRKIGGVSARALEFTILTAARLSEVLGMTWGEISGDVWIIPPERMKSRREHRTPLSKQALAVLGERRAADQLVFHTPGGVRLLDTALSRIHQRMGYRITTHGFRSTFRDWTAERTSFPNEMVEMALAHAVGDKVEAAYRRGDMFEKRRRLMDAWAQYCSVVKDESKVVPIGAMK